MIVVSDSTPLRYLVLIELEHVRPRLFGTVYAPPEVVAELQRSKNPILEPVRRGANSPPEWLVVRKPTTVDESLAQRLDRGESEAISLAHDLKAEKLLIDEKRGRKVAKEMGFEIAGTLAVLEEAAVRELIDIDQVVTKLKATNYRATDKLYQSTIENVRVRKLAQERKMAVSRIGTESWTKMVIRRDFPEDIRLESGCSTRLAAWDDRGETSSTPAPPSTS
jgi:predicted nucleic acid-binding protein